jgi:hypothetical protein
VFFESHQSYRTIDEGVRLSTSKMDHPAIAQAPPSWPVEPPPPQEPVEPPPIEQPVEAVPWQPEPETEFPPLASNSAKFWTLGISAGASLGASYDLLSFEPLWAVGTVHGTIALFKYMFIELGCDFGYLIADNITNYWSATPFGHLALFLPFINKGGWYIGAGGGYMIELIDFQTALEPYPILSFTTGFNLLNAIDISYTFRLRPDDFRMSQKVSLGYVFRFK